MISFPSLVPVRGTWVPTDQSGAALAITAVANTAIWWTFGNLVYMQATLVYPVTADASACKVGGLPFVVDANSYGEGVFQSKGAPLVGATVLGLIGTQNLQFPLGAGNTQNVQLSNLTFGISLNYIRQ